MLLFHQLTFSDAASELQVRQHEKRSYNKTCLEAGLILRTLRRIVLIMEELCLYFRVFIKMRIVLVTVLIFRSYSKHDFNEQLS